MNPERPHRDPGQLLRHWLTGDADRQDERQLDAAAQDDPFLAEAMEGYRGLPEGEHAEAVSKLKAKLRQRTQPQRRGAGFYLLRIAAVGAVLLTGWLVFQQFDGTPNGMKSVAIQQDSAPESAPAASDTVAETTTDSELAEAAPAVVESPAPAAPQRNEERLRQTRDAVAQRQQASGTAAAKAKSRPAASLDSTEQIDGLAMADSKDFAKKEKADAVAKPEADIAVLPTAPPSPMAEPGYSPLEEMARSGNSAPLIHKIVGQVTDDFGEPLTGASVLIETTQQGTVTDANGYFAIETNAIKPNLKFSYTGYEERELAISNQDFVKVELEENAVAMDEVTVSSYRKESKTSPLTIQPKGGFSKLEKHIERNLRKPAAAVDAGVTGEVLLRFRIQADGSLADFEVLKSLGHGCDEEAIRLLKEGPKWEGAVGSFATYSVKF